MYASTVIILHTCQNSYSQAVGDGAQGWCNAILYVFLSPTIRHRLIFDPCNRCLNAAIERAAELLESDTRTHATERSRLLSHTDHRHSPAKTRNGHSNYSTHDTTNSIYQSFSTANNYSDIPERSSQDQNLDLPHHSVQQTPAVTAHSNTSVDKLSNSHVYMSASDGDSHYHSRTPETSDTR